MNSSRIEATAGHVAACGQFLLLVRVATTEGQGPCISKRVVALEIGGCRGGLVNRRFIAQRRGQGGQRDAWAKEQESQRAKITCGTEIVIALLMQVEHAGAVLQATDFSRPLHFLRELIRMQILRQCKLADRTLVKRLQRTEARKREVDGHELMETTVTCDHVQGAALIAYLEVRGQTPSNDFNALTEPSLAARQQWRVAGNAKERSRECAALRAEAAVRNATGARAAGEVQNIGGIVVDVVA